MCGLFCNFFAEDIEDWLSRSLNSECSDRLKLRGPDGVYVERGLDWGVMHYHLNIRYRSGEGVQPKWSTDGSVLCAFNGEIYNSGALAQEFQLNEEIDEAFLIAELTCLLGFETMLSKLRGMYAIVVYRASCDQVFLARDWYGQKPLFYSHSDEGLTICSRADFRSGISLVDSRLGEVKKFSARYSYCETCWAGVSEVPLRAYLVFARDEVGSIFSNLSFRDEPTVFGTQETISDRACNYRRPSAFDSVRWSSRELTFFRLLEKGVSSHCENHGEKIACFLSGGIDSAVITAVAKVVGGDPTAFNMVCGQGELDELDRASHIAESLKVDLQSTKLTLPQIDSFLDISVSVYDEPFADSSQVAIFYLSEFVTSLGFRVVLTGDGGDELFHGYNRYRVESWLSNPLIAWLQRNAKLKPWTIPLVKCLVGIVGFQGKSAAKSKAARIFNDSHDDIADRYLNMIQTGAFNEDADSRKKILELRLESCRKNQTCLSDFQELDLLNYLPRDILVKTDRASMYHGLECRAPYLDEDIWYWVNREHRPKSADISKQILRRAFHYFSGKKFEPGKKLGFGIPLDTYIKSDLIIDRLKSFEQAKNLEMNEILQKVMRYRAVGDAAAQDIWNSLIVLHYLS